MATLYTFPFLLFTELIWDAAGTGSKRVEFLCFYVSLLFCVFKVSALYVFEKIVIF